MNKTLKNIIKTSLFIALGVFLFWLVYKDFDTNTLLAELKNVKYEWFILMFILGMLSHISRTIRWQMILNSDGSKVGFVNTLLAVLNGYFANIAFPRLGEVTRCAIVSKYEKQNFSKVLGTMVSERLVDVVMLALFTILAVALQSAEIKEFIVSNPDIGKNLDKYTTIPMLILYFILAIIGIIFLIQIIRGKLDNIKIFKKLNEFIKGFWLGFISLKNVKKPILFIFHSIFIWTMYFLMLYVCFFAFDGFEDLGIMVALILFVAGSFGMLAPAPNGIGAYHFMIIQTLIIYGIGQEKAAAFALTVHGIQTIILVLAGFASFILVPIVNKDK